MRFTTFSEQMKLWKVIIFTLIGLGVSVQVVNGNYHRFAGFGSANSRPVPPPPLTPPPSVVSFLMENWKDKKPITMSIYYETLCPDSVHFLQYQILPLVKATNGTLITGNQMEEKNRNPSSEPVEHLDIESLVDFRFIPYGKAVTLETPGTKVIGEQYTFLCQHGPLECEGNKLHSCTLDAISKTGNFISTYNTTQFLLCTMKYLKNPPKDSSLISALESSDLTNFSVAALNSCFEESLSIHSNLKAEIESCLNDTLGKGEHLLKQNGDLTHALQPKLYFVPWVTYNGIWTKSMLEQSQRDVKRVLCSLLTPHTMQYYNILGCQNYTAKEIQTQVEYHTPHAMKSATKLSRNRKDQAEWRLVSMHETVKRENRGAVPLPPQAQHSIPQQLIIMQRPTPSKAMIMNTRDRRGFLHSNNDAGLGSAGESAWRWRTSAHANPAQRRWRKRPINIQEVH